MDAVASPFHSSPAPPASCYTPAEATNDSSCTTTSTTTTLRRDDIMMVVDLRVTKETLHILHVSTLALELQNYAEWTLSRNCVPYALGQRGMTWRDWTNVYDKVDALWERRTMEAMEVNRDIKDRRKARSTYMIVFYTLTFGVLIGMITLGFILGATWMIGLGFGMMALVPIVVWVLITKHELRRLTETHDIKKDNMEHDWSLLADEQRGLLESLGIDVQPIREDHSSKYGKVLATTLGRDFTITDGLRFSFSVSDQQEQRMPYGSSSNNEGSLPMLSNSSTTQVAAIHDLDRLLQLNQTGEVETEEYQRLKSRILSKMALPYQYESLPRENVGVRPRNTAAATAAVVTALEEADINVASDEKQVVLELV